MSKKFVRQERSSPKHPHYSSTQPITQEARVPANFSVRPEWRGNGHQKPKKRRGPSHEVASRSEREKELEIANSIALGLQQKLLDVFKNTFPVCTEEYETLRPVLTAVKTCLDNVGTGDSQQRTFGEAEMRQVFLVRWGAERALALAALLVGWTECTFPEEPVFERLRPRDPGPPLNVLSIGNGPALMMALSVLLRRVQPGSAALDAPDEKTTRQPVVALQLVQDSTDWASEATALLAALLAPPTLSKYASAAAKAASCPFLPLHSLDLLIHPPDVLEGLTALVGPRPCLIAMCFSLREMQIASVAKTVKFLIALTKDAPRESLLVVVDEVDGADSADVSKKTRPLRFLLELVLLGRDGKDSDKAGVAPEASWVRLVGDEERIFKVDPGLDYPLSLGKIGLQVHLFKRI